jgi:peptide/nickel transport system permease protein
LLAGVALIIQYLAGLGLGIAAARRAGTRTDHLLRAGSVLLYALPVFWTGLMALSLFSFRLHWLPGGLMHSINAAELGLAARLLDLLRHLLLPSLILAIAAAGATVRFTRNSVLEVLGRDYIRTARAKGLTEKRVIWVHALRNAATPLVQLLGLSLPFLLSGSLIVEVVFAWPGLGRLAWESVLSRDYPVILATTALSGVLVIAGNLLADLCQAGLDPRVRE